MSQRPDLLERSIGLLRSVRLQVIRARKRLSQRISEPIGRVLMAIWEPIERLLSVLWAPFGVVIAALASPLLRMTDAFERTLFGVARVVADYSEPILRERPTMEHVLLVSFFVIGVYMYVAAEEFGASAQVFPQLMAATTAILSGLLLVRNYLDAVAPVALAVGGVYFAYTGATTWIDDGTGAVRTLVGAALAVVAVVERDRVGDATKSFVAEPMQVLGEDDVGASEEEEEDESAATGAYTYDIVDRRGPAVTGLLSVLYMVLTFAIGMLYSTPIFVVMYGLWARMSPARTIALALFSFAIAFAFYWVISDDIAEGWYTGWEPTPPDELIGLAVSNGGLLVDVVVILT